LGAVLALGLAAGCKGRNLTGELTPPADAAAWDARHAQAFDDHYTRQPINLSGRAPHDVRDQQLLARRMGFADVLAEVKVLQVWGKGRYQGRQEQFLELEIERLLVGRLLDGTSDRQFVMVQATDPLPGTLQGQSLLLFLRWAPGEVPPYHHHLMPVEPASMAFIAAVIDHAKQEGVLDPEGVPKGSGRGGARGKRSRKGKSGKGAGAD
jgi:hypothetical protein